MGIKISHFHPDFRALLCLETCTLQKPSSFLKSNVVTRNWGHTS